MLPPPHTHCHQPLTHLKYEDLAGFGDDNRRFCRDHEPRSSRLGDIIFQPHDLLDAGQGQFVVLEVLLMKTTDIRTNVPWGLSQYSSCSKNSLVLQKSGQNKNYNIFSTLYVYKRMYDAVDDCNPLS